MELSKLSKDLLIELALELSLPDLLRLCQSSKRNNKLLCESDTFWRRKLAKDYPDVDRRDNPKFKYMIYSTYEYATPISPSKFNGDINIPKDVFRMEIERIIKQYYSIMNDANDFKSRRIITQRVNNLIKTTKQLTKNYAKRLSKNYNKHRKFLSTRDFQKLLTNIIDKIKKVKRKISIMYEINRLINESKKNLEPIPEILSESMIRLMNIQSINIDVINNPYFKILIKDYNDYKD